MSSLKSIMHRLQMAKNSIFLLTNSNTDVVLAFLRDSNNESHYSTNVYENITRKNQH